MWGPYIDIQKSIAGCSPCTLKSDRSNSKWILNELCSKRPPQTSNNLHRRLPLFWALLCLSSGSCLVISVLTLWPIWFVRSVSSSRIPRPSSPSTFSYLQNVLTHRITVRCLSIQCLLLHDTPFDSVLQRLCFPVCFDLPDLQRHIANSRFASLTHSFRRSNHFWSFFGGLFGLSTSTFLSLFAA
jgi:hypothetical protein